MKSFSFYILSQIIKLKRIKKVFSEAPINYKKLREKNVHVPLRNQVLGLETKSFIINKTEVTAILPNEINSENIILYCPGGSFVSGPNDFNWKSIARIVKDTGMVGYMINYPKAPEHQIEEINNAIDVVYNHFTAKHKAKDIILLGGSVGGTLMTLLVQRLIKKQSDLPKQLILITPVMDCSMSNKYIATIEPNDIMNSKAGIISAYEMCAGSIDLTNAIISPNYGEYERFIPTLLFIAENDVNRPDAELFCEMLTKNNIPLQVEYGKGMPHIYPLLPISEGRTALKKIIEYLSWSRK